MDFRALKLVLTDAFFGLEVVRPGYVASGKNEDGGLWSNEGEGPLGTIGFVYSLHKTCNLYPKAQNQKSYMGGYQY